MTAATPPESSVPDEPIKSEPEDDGYWDSHDPFRAAQISQDTQTDMDA